jgi:serine/threonine-protein kinase HipA
LAINENDATASVDLAFAVASQFGLKAEVARIIAGEVGKAVSGWRGSAARLGLAAREITRMESAFEHGDLRLACGEE